MPIRDSGMSGAILLAEIAYTPEKSHAHSLF